MGTRVLVNVEALNFIFNNLRERITGNVVHWFLETLPSLWDFMGNILIKHGRELSITQIIIVSVDPLVVPSRAGHAVLFCAVLWEILKFCVKFAVKILYFAFETLPFVIVDIFCCAKIYTAVQICCAVLWAKTALMSSPGLISSGWHRA